ncbi:MAG: hypothetical protein C4K48_09520 [Candidatus Thorarchaeota archaeon]|nr:MAG: hypothetical protein C4K48_09520 [Candidatus Thorarchaeota archaeon]
MRSARKLARVFRNYDLAVKELHVGFGAASPEKPSVVIDHTSYPGVEAHLFTIADAALWNAQFTSDRDVLLSQSVIDLEAKDQAEPTDASIQAWSRLTSVLSSIMDCMKFHKESIARGQYGTVIWGQHATEWHRELWESRIHELVPPSEFIDYVDTSIRPHITELNDLGFTTVESCSGMLIDHPDREPYRPYVMFDERSYRGATPHFFALGDMAGWETMYAPHGFDVYIRVFTSDDTEDAWARLVRNARILGPLLAAHRRSNGRGS